MTKLYVMSGGAKHVLSQEGVEVVEFTEDQLRAANLLHTLPSEDLNALFAHVKAHPVAAKKRGRKSAAPTAPKTGKKRGRKSNAEKAAAAAAAGTAPVVATGTITPEVKSEAA